MTSDDAEGLVGHWSSAPYDYGVMESADLGFLPDGRGWSAWSNAAGAMHVVRFRWTCPAPGELELKASWYAEGYWTPDAPGLASADGSGPDDEVTRTAFTIGPRTPPYHEEPVVTLELEEAVEYCTRFGRGDRGITPSQDPSHALFPYD